MADPFIYPLPVYFRKGTNPLTSYNFIDIAAGTAYKTSYGLSTGSIYYLSPVQFDSDYNNYSSSATISDPSASVKVNEVNFDLLFDNTSQVVSGKMIINATFELGIAGGGTTAKGNLKFRVLHVNSGGTETEIGAQYTTPEQTTTSSFSYRVCAMIDVSRKFFGPGEKLRIEIEQWGWRPGGTGVCTNLLYHDGSGRAAPSTGGTFTNDSNLIIAIPLEVNT